jgi:formyl-CoA transferase
MWCPSVSLSVWTNAWLAGHAAPDDVLDALNAWAPLHSVAAYDAVAAGRTGLPWPDVDPAGAMSLLQTVRTAAGRNPGRLPGAPQVIDVALYEAVFNCMESLLPEFSAFGAIREAAGSALPGIAPSNAYKCQDGGYVLIAGNGDSIFKRLMHTMVRDDLGLDPDLADNAGRVKCVEEIDAAIGAWTATLSVAQVLELLDAASVPAGRIYTVADIATDPHYQARDMILQTVMADGSTLALPGIVPKLSRTPGSHRRNAPEIGQDTDAVLQDIGLTEAQIQALKDKGIVQ